MPNAKKLLPVVHVLDEAQAIRNAEIAFEAGAHGLFLINHETSPGNRPLSFAGLLNIHSAVADQFPNQWIGVNCLDLLAAEVFQYLTPQVAGVWADNGEIDEHVSKQTSAERILDAKTKSGWDGLYFGGVAFKYQKPVDDAGRAAEIAQNYMDVVTTSGPATGHRASTTKIKLMKEAIGNRPLAIASGITVENVAAYLPFVDYFLVATGISQSFYQLDPIKVSSLAKTIDRYSFE